MMYVLALGALALLFGTRRGSVTGARSRPAGSTEAPPTADHEEEDDTLADLNLLHPDFHATVLDIVTDLEAQGWPVRVYETYRSAERQAELKAAGRSQVSWSLHQATDADGNPAALAADIIHASDGWNNKDFFDALADAAERHGATSGHRWKWRDSAHVQAIPVTAQRAVQAGADPRAYMGLA